jgi:hypothetical protein
VLILGLTSFATAAAGAILVTDQGGEFEVLVQYYCGSPDPIESSREVIETDNLKNFSDQRSIVLEDDCGMGSAAGTWSASISETQIDLGYELSTEVVDCGGAISTASAYVSFQLEESTTIVLTSQGSWEPTNEQSSSPSARLFVNGVLHHLWHLNDEGTEHRLETVLEPGDYTFAILGSSLRGLRTANGTCLALPGTTHGAGWARLVFESGQIVSTGAESFGAIRARY